MPKDERILARTIKTVGLFSKSGDRSVKEVLERIYDFLRARGLDIVLEETTAGLLASAATRTAAPDQIARAVDLAIIIGGDGTMLNVARRLAPQAVPLIGVNLGRRGFLTDIPKDSVLDSLASVLDGDFRSEQRIMLNVELRREDRVVHTANALNDVVVNKGQLARLIEFEVHVDGEFVSSTRGDGIIVATPTGSTAYALSAGGPILHPTLPALVLVPICPHTLSHRPVAINSSSRVEIVMINSSNQSAFLTFDGQMGHALQDHDRICVRRSDHPVTLIHPSDHSHYDVLRTKLRWGENF
ncbi:MAG: NAD(+) kinase [Gammaproteobacteria bacterium]|nr:NAD(+) kinase [Gammaproteobacteria bacterium]